MPDEWVAQLALAGTPSTVAARVQQLGAAGVTSSVMIPVGADPLESARSLARVL